MKKRFFSLFILSCCLFIFVQSAAAKTFESKVIDNALKDWTVTFNSEVTLHPNDINTIYIKSDSGEHHPVSLALSTDKKQVIITPKSPYLLENLYTVVITKQIRSAAGKSLKTDVTMPFKVQGKHIRSIEAIVNPLVTNVKVQGTKDVARMTVSVNGTQEETLHLYKNQQFRYGLIGLVSGDQLKICAYNEQGQLLEEQYQVAE